MTQYKPFTRSVVMQIVVTMAALTAIINNAAAEENQGLAVAFPDKYMIRLGAYIIDGSDTQFSVSSDVLGLGTVIDYSRDLGGEDSGTIPRIDAYYRFNERHSINFTSFTIDRNGSRAIAIDPPITIGDVTYSGETINSSIKYTLYKVGYGYSFYHSSKVELTLTAGLNITSNDLSFSNDAGDKVESAGFTVPLPMFGLRMGYAITPKWSVNYVSEAFFIDFENTVKGALVSYEINTEYKLFKNFAIGAGLARLGANFELDANDWKGKVSDSYRGITLFSAFYF